MEKANHHLDDNGLPYLYPEYWLNPDEYRKKYSEINKIYETQYKDKPICAHPSFDVDGSSYIYWFENYGFNNYNIYLKNPNNY